ncbi:hypothetical protein KAX75_01100 [candidate division WOR-3 bacterium]|nr:hypothetical protein [candidate division WOR-3 bacterium]
MNQKHMKNKREKGRKLPIQKDIVLFKTRNGKTALEVKLREETIWLTQKQIALLFNTKRPAITKHLSNIFKSGELCKKSVCSKMEHTANDSKTYKTQFYNLDVMHDGVRNA